MMFRNKQNIEILRKALAVIAEEEAAKLPSAEECAHITFSEEFERKMQKLINQQKKSYYYLINTVGKRVACIVIAVLIALSTVTFSVEALRESVVKFFVETFEKFSIIRVEDAVNDNSVLETYYAPTYIPEGYELRNCEDNLSAHRKTYIANENSVLYFEQYLKHVKIKIDTEGTKTAYIKICGREAFYTIENEKQMIYWVDEEYRYL